LPSHERFSVVPAAYVFLLRTAGDRGREVLLQLRQGTGYMDGHWAAAVAGHVEKGETVYDAAHREAAEEAGISDVQLVPWCAMQRTGLGDDPIGERVDYFFVAEKWTGTPKIQEPDKTADLQWFPLAALPTPVVPHEERVIATILEGRSLPILVHGFLGPV
jgi:8-oxo-dGTP pyrophosphatase MutT (NUDIX family)